MLGEVEALDGAVVERDMRRLARPRAATTAKPWFWLVTSTRPVRRSSTGWLAPRWPNGSFVVSWPVASPSS